MYIYTIIPYVREIQICSDVPKWIIIATGPWSNTHESHVNKVDESKQRIGHRFPIDMST